MGNCSVQGWKHWPITGDYNA